MCRRTLLFRAGVAVSLVLLVGLAGGLWGRYGRPPKAPPPPEPTAAELIVGSWHYVERAPAPFVAEGDFHFRTDGTLLIEWSIGGHKMLPQEGTYRVEGDRLYHDVYNPNDGLPTHRKWYSTILSITRDRLTVFTTELDQREGVFDRIP